MLDSVFRNVTGFTANRHLMSALDVARLTSLIIANYPRCYWLLGLRSVRFGRNVFRNRNLVLGEVKGSDGLKTGHTKTGGYGLVATAQRGKHRLIMVINGLRRAAARRKETLRMFRWGFKQLVVQE
ncbi:MAG: hypothetical protein OXC54_11060 [Rhodospirillaceae bacterium]|nr:hypothetical protein [Rhodospirillaceae bacterium]